MYLKRPFTFWGNGIDMYFGDLYTDKILRYWW